MTEQSRFMTTVALIVALGGFLMGFDASVISGVVGSIEREFQLSKIEVGWSVSSLALTATFAMMVAGPLSDRLGRRRVLRPPPSCSRFRPLRRPWRRPSSSSSSPA